MAATTGAYIIKQHPTNPTQDTHISSNSSKGWARAFPAITNFNVWTTVRGPEAVDAQFDGPFLPELEDDNVRFAQTVYPPNSRQWRLYSEEDGINWFHTEISNPVLGLCTSYPSLLQAAHEKPLSEEHHAETVDIGYSVARAGQLASQRRHVVIGEFKRCLLAPRQWQNGRLVTEQLNFSRELRG